MSTAPVVKRTVSVASLIGAIIMQRNEYRQKLEEAQNTVKEVNETCRGIRALGSLMHEWLGYINSVSDETDKSVHRRLHVIKSCIEQAMTGAPFPALLREASSKKRARVHNHTPVDGNPVKRVKCGVFTPTDFFRNTVLPMINSKMRPSECVIIQAQQKRKNPEQEAKIHYQLQIVTTADNCWLRKEEQDRETLDDSKKSRRPHEHLGMFTCHASAEFAYQLAVRSDDVRLSQERKSTLRDILDRLNNGSITAVDEVRRLFEAKQE